MENARKQWSFRGNEKLNTDRIATIRGTLDLLTENINKEDKRPIIPFSHGDPAAFPSFRTSLKAESAVVDALQSAQFNTYSSCIGILPARRAVAEYLSLDLPYKLSPDDVYITVGSAQAMEVIVAVLASPGANVLLPRPGFPNYEARCLFSQLDFRHYDLLPDKGWEVDLDSLEALADENTAAIVIINPGNPCGNVFSFEHLKKIAETAQKLGILVITDEVYEHLTFGDNPFIPMASFGSIVPVITLGSLSKKWAVPGWRVGWLATCDPTGTLQKSGIMEHIKACLEIDSDPATFIQAALPQILQETEGGFFLKYVNLLKQGSDILYDRIKEIPCITCPRKPEGSFFAMVQLDVSLLEGINDDTEFCFELAKEESVIILPGVMVGLKNWVRLCFALELSILEDALARINSFCQRHAEQH
ncbi:nicotianamine aminotransferase 1 [Ricinus communis]|uniref:Tyrosine aminotransferase, putative n=1 Tax=Ricinus communis TaxID=3988 RepID=B9RVU9_RICCO|nr:nicotianamine aminotransferase 1 [Ricinus communis]EEF44386.1 tyrosine aminotransferase, putative [Ricinus communis]|eukprot:XP_002517868.1 tyrosine aminotransferase [Ricinus communis]